MLSESEVVLHTLSEVEGLDDVQQIVDRVCCCVAEITPYRLVLLSIYFESDVYVGLEGGSEAMRRRFVESTLGATQEKRQRVRERMWRECRIQETNIVWIPEEAGMPVGPAFTPSEEVEGAEWRPRDRLLIFVRGTKGEVHGVLSLDRPSDGKRPDPRDLGTLQVVDGLMKLMGAVIHNKHLAKKLRESEERYASVVEQGHDGILIVRGEEIRFANRRVGEMLECEPDSLIGRPLSSIVRGGEWSSVTAEPSGTLVKQDGTEVEVSLRKATIRFGGQEATLLAAADISERQRILSQLMRTQKLESVGTLASGIAHDFNNLLSGILGYASLLRARLSADDSGLRYLDSIERATERAADVTRQLLGIARDDRARVAPFAVARVVDELSALLRETLEPNIVVETRIADGLPLVLGDETQIHQVLLNVCLNARDAMPHGGRLKIDLCAAEKTADRLFLVARVSDNGEGMDAPTLSKVFDPFFTTKDAGQGSGLGLYMAYRIVERHGGTMDITSEPGLGTMVEIFLPGCEQRAGGPAAPASGDELVSSGSVLLVDDEELVRDVCGEMLTSLGYRVLTAGDGEEAIRAVRKAPASLRCVILDIAMPGMSGWEAARIIGELRPDLPLLISSGHDIRIETGDAPGVEPAGCLKKPYGLVELRAALREAGAFTASDVS